MEEEEREWAGKPSTVWRYQIAQGIDPEALSVKSVPEMLVPTPDPQRREGGVRLPTDISGNDSGDCLACGEPLAAVLIAAGLRHHDGCAA